MKIYNTIGQEVRELVEGEYQAGMHTVSWDGKTDNGNPVSSGLYFYQIKAGSFSQIKKMSMIR
jgi:flagellar hook assembly protein FlgD